MGNQMDIVDGHLGYGVIVRYVELLAEYTCPLIGEEDLHLVRVWPTTSEGGAVVRGAWLRCSSQ